MTTTNETDFERMARILTGTTPDHLRAVHALGKWLAAPEPPYDLSGVPLPGLRVLVRRGVTANVRGCAQAEINRRADLEELARRAEYEAKRIAFEGRRDLFLRELTTLCRKHDVELAAETDSCDGANLVVRTGVPTSGRFELARNGLDEIEWNYSPRPHEGPGELQLWTTGVRS